MVLLGLELKGRAPFSKSPPDEGLGISSRIIQFLPYTSPVKQETVEFIHPCLCVIL